MGEWTSPEECTEQGRWMRNRRAEVSKVTWKLTAFGSIQQGGEGEGGLFGGAQSD